MDRLVVRCLDDAEDSIEFCRQDGFISAEPTISDPEDGPAIVLNAAKARRLAQWLFEAAAKLEGGVPVHDAEVI